MIKSVVLLAFISVILCANFMSCTKESPSEPELTLAQELQNELDNALETSNGMGHEIQTLVNGRQKPVPMKYLSMLHSWLVGFIYISFRPIELPYLRKWL